jgi:ribosome-associated protein
MADELRVTPDCAIPLSEIEWRFGPSGGPGGQHANRAHPRVEATFDVESSLALTEAQRARVRNRVGPVVRVVADGERSQSRNRAAALDRLAERLAAALHVPKSRRPTKPSRSAKARRVDEKRKRGETKKLRGRPTDE